MKMYLGNVPIKSMNIKHYELNTNDSTVKPSDLQSGVTCYGKGKKITGTGKCFEFASYGEFLANDSWPVPNSINVIQITSLDYPIQTLVDIRSTTNLDFSVEQTIGNLISDNTEYPIKVTMLNNILTITCDKSVEFHVFYGKDRYVS